MKSLVLTALAVISLELPAQALAMDACGRPSSAWRSVKRPAVFEWVNADGIYWQTQALRREITEDDAKFVSRYVNTADHRIIAAILLGRSTYHGPRGGEIPITSSDRVRCKSVTSRLDELMADLPKGLVLYRGLVLPGSYARERDVAGDMRRFLSTTIDRKIALDFIRTGIDPSVGGTLVLTQFLVEGSRVKGIYPRGIYDASGVERTQIPPNALENEVILARGTKINVLDRKTEPYSTYALPGRTFQLITETATLE